MCIPCTLSILTVQIMILHATHRSLFQVMHELLQALSGMTEGVKIFAESEPSIIFTDVHVLFAVELAFRFQQKRSIERKRRCLTSLTGMEETPISMAMNQQALDARVI